MTDGAQRHAPRPAGPEVLAALEAGITRFHADDLEGAHRLFEGAHRRASGDPRIASWYGLTLVLVERNSSLGIMYVDQAVRVAGPTPELALNQARVAISLGQRDRAIRALERGMEAVPGEASLLRARITLGRRRPPVLRFLPRSSLLNRWLGKLRHRWSREAAAVAAVPSAALLGRLPGGARPPAPPAAGTAPASAPQGPPSGSPEE